MHTFNHRFYEQFYEQSIINVLIHKIPNSLKKFYFTRLFYSNNLLLIIWSYPVENKAGARALD